MAGPYFAEPYVVTAHATGISMLLRERKVREGVQGDAFFPPTQGKEPVTQSNESVTNSNESVAKSDDSVPKSNESVAGISR